MKTLVVEDNANERKLLRINLERHGCSVIEAADGVEGLERISEVYPDLIISDALMPRMDGYQFLRKLKTDDNLKSIPFIFYSATYTGQREVELAVAIGADAFIIKPKDPDEFWTEILSILEKCKLRPQPVPPVKLIQEDEEYLSRYSSMIAAKLEEKITECEKGFTELKRTQAELELKTAELERSNAELEHFAHVASHDLKAPLISVGGFAAILQKKYGDRLDAKGREYLSRIMDGTTRMELLINDLMSYARVTTHARPFRPVSCNTVLGVVLSNLGAAIEESGADISFDDLPTVTGDETQLIQLFQNLISNAITYRGHGPPEIRISVKPVSDPDAQAAIRIGRVLPTGQTAMRTGWLFSISDFGIGINPLQFEQIFKIFQRLHTDDSKYPGTGIGLALCKKIVERHGGRIWVESQPGKGSTFYFTVP